MISSSTFLVFVLLLVKGYSTEETLKLEETEQEQNSDRKPGNQLSLNPRQLGFNGWNDQRFPPTSWNGQGTNPYNPWNPNPSQIRPRCYQPRGQFPHDFYCDKFYNCWDGNAVEQSCPSGLMFNDDPRRPYCDYPSNVQCNGRIQSRSLTNSFCPESYGLFPHPSDCSLFLSCNNGIPNVMPCGRGLYFNPDFKICDYPYNVRCSNDVTIRPEVDPGFNPFYRSQQV